MKHKFLIFSCILLLFACKKEKIDDPNFVGKWVLINDAGEYDNAKIIVKQTNCLDDNIFNSATYGNIIVDIKTNGEFVFESNSGSETFKMASKKTREVTITNQSGLICNGSPVNASYSVSGFDIVLRNKKGRKFKFPLFYIPQLDRLVTVPWIKNCDYYANDRVYANYYNGPFYSFNSSASPYYNQVLGKFKKL